MKAKNLFCGFACIAFAAAFLAFAVMLLIGFQDFSPKLKETPVDKLFIAICFMGGFGCSALLGIGTFYNKNFFQHPSASIARMATVSLVMFTIGMGYICHIIILISLHQWGFLHVARYG